MSRGLVKTGLYDRANLFIEFKNTAKSHTKIIILIIIIIFFFLQKNGC